MVPITSEAMDTGPTAKCLELPKTEYISGGTKLESGDVTQNSSYINHYTIQQMTFSFTRQLA